MSFPNCDNPPSHESRRGWLRRPGGSWLGYGVLAVVGIALLVAVLRGCRQRPVVVRVTPQMDAAPQFWVRVLLAADMTGCTIESPAAFQVSRADAGPEAPAEPPVLTSAGNATKVSFLDGRFVFGGTPLAGSELIIAPQSPYVFTLNGQSYRGKLKLVVSRSGQRFDAINLVPLEPYLAGVVGAEMPDYWEPQALRAQAIAARTYCLYTKNRFGANRRWDVSRTQANQVYAGVGGESAQTWDAVNRTYGKVLIWPELTKEHGAMADSGLRIADSRREFDPQSTIDSLQFRGLFPTYYSSICGGHTADGEGVFGDRCAPLKGVPCPYCKDVAKPTLYLWPMVWFDRDTVTKQLTGRYPALASLGPIEELTVTGQEDYGSYTRATCIRLVGATGKTDTLRAEDLRLALDPTGRKIKSMVCRIVPWDNGWAFLAGRGWGHGVGMCQCGAEGMARLGRDAESILQYYYPGGKLVNIY
jgi:stage II sporulation protein D